MEVSPNSRAQSPACSRAQGAAGELRLHAILGILLSILAAFFGRRYAAHHLALPACDTAGDWWINLPESDSESAVDDILASDLPLQIRRLLYLFGTSRNRGMRRLSRAMPPARARIARGPPAPELSPAPPNPRQITPRWGR